MANQGRESLFRGDRYVFQAELTNPDAGVRRAAIREAAAQHSDRG